MCGICGKFNFEPDSQIDPFLVRSMLESIRHRGPDDEGVYVRPGIGLGHRRLSIIDLQGGHQPLSNEDGTVWIVFNGEIYNFQELRETLASKGHRFRTRTDTEVIVHLYEELGPDCLTQLRGMFAFAIWDERERTLFLARDRTGIKPLYYCQTRNALLFASEIKAILADPAVPREVQPEVIDRFLTFHYLPGEETLLKGIYKLPPGHYLRVRNGRTELRQFWDLAFAKPARPRSVKQAEEELLALLAESVKLHMIADVPVGVLLSGGVDSTAVLSLAVEQTGKKIQTYTVGFSDPGIADERPYARLAAETFGSSHHEMTISADDFRGFLPDFAWHMEEPVCEPPAIAMYYVSKLARQDVKVLLSGEGGDEAFAGYSNYRNLLWMERLKQLGPGVRGAAGWGLRAAGKWLDSPLPGKYAPLVNARFPEYYFSRTSNLFRYLEERTTALYTQGFAAAVDHEIAVQPIRRLQANARQFHPLDAMLYIDTKSWLPDDLLIKADKMTMANSLELRVPLLDHKVLEFAAALPANFKVRRFTTKYLAKKALARRVPAAILKRRKAGFPVPYESWLRNELRGWTHDVLLDRTAVNRGYFDATAIRKLLAENTGTAVDSKRVFSLLALELWHRAFLDSSRPETAGRPGCLLVTNGPC